MTIAVEFFAPPGQSLTLLVCKRYTYTSVNGAGDAATETARAGLYTATIAEALSGWHTAHIVAAAGWELPIGDVYLAATGICRVRDHDPQVSAEIAELDVVPLAASSTPLPAGTLSFRRGDTVTASIPLSIDPATATAVVFSAKRHPAVDADTAAIIQVTVAGGLTKLNAATADDAALATLTTSGLVATLTIHGTATANLAVKDGLYWDVQMIDADGDPVTIAEGRLNVTADVTRATA